MRRERTRSEKGKDEDGFKRKTGRLPGYDGSGRARGGKRGKE